MTYTTFLGKTYEDEHDEELTRKFGDTYNYFKKEYPGLHKLPTEEVEGIYGEFKKSPYGDTFEKSVDRTKQYINQRMPQWQKQYINPETKQVVNGLSTSYPQAQRQSVSFQNTTSGAFAKEQDPSLSQPKEYSHHLNLSGFPNNKWQEKTDFEKHFPTPINTSVQNNPLINDCVDSPRYQEFINNTKRREGGYTTKMESPTNTGITQRTLNDVLDTYPIFKGVYPKRVKDLTQEQIENIYCQEYYKPPHGELINHPRLRDMTLDQNVMRDRKSFVDDLQKLLNEYGVPVDTDGVLGSQTLNALNNLKDPDAFVDFAKKRLPEYLKNSPKFENGWKNRINQY